jgi:hypothetical protein
MLSTEVPLNKPQGWQQKNGQPLLPLKPNELLISLCWSNKPVQPLMSERLPKLQLEFMLMVVQLSQTVKLLVWRKSQQVSRLHVWLLMTEPVLQQPRLPTPTPRALPTVKHSSQRQIVPHLQTQNLFARLIKHLWNELPVFQLRKEVCLTGQRSWQPKTVQHTPSLKPWQQRTEVNSRIKPAQEQSKQHSQIVPHAFRQKTRQQSQPWMLLMQQRKLTLTDRSAFKQRIVLLWQPLTPPAHCMQAKLNVGQECPQMSVLLLRLLPAWEPINDRTLPILMQQQPASRSSKLKCLLQDSRLQVFKITLQGLQQREWPK